MNIMLDNSATEANKQANEVFVAQQRIQVEEDKSAVYLEYGLWGIGLFLFFYIFITKPTDDGFMVTLLKALCTLVPAAVFFWMKKQAESYFAALMQKVNAAASEIDNYIRQRGVILGNLFQLTKESVSLDKDVMAKVAAYRGGVSPDGGNRNEVASAIDNGFRALLPQIEAYPDLKAHSAIADAMQQNQYLEREITATRTHYNDLVAQWNRDVFQWPIKRMVAAKMRLKTLIPFALGADEKRNMENVSYS